METLKLINIKGSDADYEVQQVLDSLYHDYYSRYNENMTLKEAEEYNERIQTEFKDFDWKGIRELDDLLEDEKSEKSEDEKNSEKEDPNHLVMKSNGHINILKFIVDYGKNDDERSKGSERSEQSDDDECNERSKSGSSERCEQSDEERSENNQIEPMKNEGRGNEHNKSIYDQLTQISYKEEFYELVVKYCKIKISYNP